MGFLVYERLAVSNLKAQCSCDCCVSVPPDIIHWREGGRLRSVMYLEVILRPLLLMLDANETLYAELLKLFVLRGAYGAPRIAEVTQYLGHELIPPTEGNLEGRKFWSIRRCKIDHKLGEQLGTTLIWPAVEGV